MRSRSVRWWLLLGLAATLAAPPARAQDAHYWSRQFGPSASLLAGAVIGSVEGLPAVYYNPARLVTVERTGFALSAHVFGWEKLTVENGVEPGEDLSSSRNGLEPSLIAGTLPFGGENETWAYSVLTRQSVDTDIGAFLLLEDPTAVFTSGLGDLRIENQVLDYWGGISWAREFAPGLGVGITGFSALRTTDRRAEIVSMGVGPSASAAAIDLRSYEFWHLRALAKLGAWYRLATLDLGLTLTTPSLGIAGKGDAGGVLGVLGTAQPDVIIAAQRSDLDADFRSPLSVGAGAAWTVGSTRVHASAEWFDALDRYDVLQAEPLGGARLAVVHATDSVFNWGVAVEHRVSDGVELFAGYAIDRSAAPGGEINLGTAPWDIEIVTGGTRLELPWLQLTLGLGVAFGESPVVELVELGGVGNETLIEVDESNVLRYRNWRAIFGFEF